MRKRLLNAAAIVTLLILVGLVIWQGSFNMGKLGPANVGQVYLYWAMSTLVFLLMVWLAFMLFRLMVKLYIERSRDHEGSRINRCEHPDGRGPHRVHAGRNQPDADEPPDRTHV